MTTAGSVSDPHLMQCMEVWGGSESTQNRVTMSGLDAWVYSCPHEQARAGGDVYYVSSCATGRITRLLLADVSGHGSVVCDVAQQLRGLMRQFVNQLDQTAFVRAMNRQFTELSADGCFATAIITTFFSPTNSLTLCNAGHPSPLLYRAKEKAWSMLGRNSEREERAESGTHLFDLPLGVEGITDYSQFAVDLAPGDLVLCYSDSLIETRNHAGEMLGEGGLLETARGVTVGEPGAMMNDLIARVRENDVDALTDDDVTVLMFSPTTAGEQAPLAKRLSAPWRLMRAGVHAIRHHDRIPWPDLSVANLGGMVFGSLNHFAKRHRSRTSSVR